MLSLHWGSASDVGKVRHVNEDAFWTSASLFVVADGMGGHAAGEIASQIAVADLRRLTTRSPLRAEDVETAIARANDHILRAGVEHRERFGMGTTITGLAVVEVHGQPELTAFNVGDSRVYRFADSELSQVTVDHSEVQALIDAGGLTPEQGRNYPRRNIVTRSLGTHPAPVADLWQLPVVSGDRFLICSDGLNTELDDDEIATVLSEDQDPQAAAIALVERALTHGGNDNVTTVVVDVG